MFYLASRSPRRRALLEAVGLKFSVLAPGVEESAAAGEAPEETVARLAREKAAAGRLLVERRSLAKHPVLAADTEVVVDGATLGKPVSMEHAMEMLARLSGRTHQVLTSVVLCSDNEALQRTSITDVTMMDLTRSQMERYWNTGEPRDKAGGYAIQGIGGGFVSRLDGSYSGVMGLPAFETRELLARAGIDWL